MTNEILEKAKKTAETFNATLSVLVHNDWKDIEHFLELINQDCFGALYQVASPQEAISLENVDKSE